MTNLELSVRFEQRLQNHINKNLDIRTIDIEFYLNEGYRRFIEYWYSLYESDEAARKRLSPLVVNVTRERTDPTVPTTTNAHPNGEFWYLPTDCRYVLLEDVTIDLDDCHGDPTTNRAYVKPVKLEYYNLHINNPYKKPYKDLVWRLDIGSRIHELIIGDDSTQVKQYHITYIKNPANITLLTGTPQSTSIEISAEYHEEIIEKALEVAIPTLQLINSSQNK